MRKIYKTLFTAVLALTGLSTASAQKTYYDVDPDPVTEITAGQDYVISICYGSSGGQKLLTPEGHTSQASESTVYRFEEVGTNAAGDKTWHLKNVSTGFYIQDPDLDATAVSYTESPARAFTFTAKQIVWSSTWSATGGSDPTTYSYGTGTAGYPTYDYAFTFCNVNYASSSYKWFCLYNANKGGWAQYATANSYLIYPLVEASPANSFVYSYDELFGTTKTPATLFTAGTAPGQVPEADFEALQKVYDEATALYNSSETAADDVYTDVQKRMEEAYSAAQAARLPLTEGYYIIYNSQTSRAGGKGAIYDDGSALYWEEFIHNDSTGLTLDGAKHIWKAEKAADGSGNFTFLNVQTGRYFGTTTSTSTAVPTATTAAKSFSVAHQTSDAFSIDGNFNGAYTSLHAQESGQKVVIWIATSGASGWKFVPVSADEISALDDQIAQKKRNEESVSLVEEAKILTHNGITLKSDATHDGLYDARGLVADSTCFWSNACETTEGSLAGLLDNNQTTYFHSVWSDASYAGIVHCLGVDLGEAVQYVDFKYSRRNANAAGTPRIIHLYASNDTTTAASWVDQGLYELSYDYAANETYTTNPTLAGFTGIKAFVLDAPYRYLRLDVEHTLSDAKTNGNLYFHLSEARFYKGTYDAENSPIEAVPEEVRTQLAGAITTVENEMSEGDVTEDAFNALKEAIGKYESSFPDPAVLNELIEEAKAQLAAAEEGEDLGYFKEGAKTALQAGIAEVEGSVKPVMTATEISNATAKINEVIAAFNAMLVTPADGDYITIMSASSSEATGAAGNSYLYASASDETVIKWGGYDSEKGTDDNLSTRLNYIWKVTKNDDGSFTLRNMGTGMYFGNPKTNNVSVLASAEPDSVTLRSAKTAGLFNIVLADGIYSNAQPSTNKLVSWGTANGTDNSAFQFSVINNEWSEGYHCDVANAVQLITLPMEITADPAGAVLCGVLGVKDNTIQLKAYDTGDKIAAGQAFIYVPNADNEATETDFYPTAGSLDEIELDMTPKSADGLIGVLLPATPGAGYGMLYNGKVINTSAEDEIAANTGYFSKELPVTTETGAYSLPLEGTLTGIATAIVDNAEIVNVYTTSGVLVRKGVKRADALNGLPAGLYIAGSKKALVK